MLKRQHAEKMIRAFKVYRSISEATSVSRREAALLDDAFNTIYAEFDQRIRGVARMYTQHMDDFDDVCQFLKIALIRAICKFKLPVCSVDRQWVALRNYVHVSLKNERITRTHLGVWDNMYRSSNVHISPTFTDIEMDSGEIASCGNNINDYMDVQSLLDCIPPHKPILKDIINLLIEGYTLAEISKTLDITVTAVRSGINSLRELYQPVALPSHR